MESIEVTRLSDRLKKRKRRIPKKELFKIQKKILILIFNENKELLTKNKIYDRISNISKEEGQTGLRFKQNTLDSIRALEEMGLVKIDEEGAQKENVVLTQVGKEMTKLIIALENYNTSYFTLINALNEKVFFIPGRNLGFIGVDLKKVNLREAPDSFKKEVEDMIFKLIDKGWKREEIKFYNEIRTNLLDFKVICDTNFFNMILPRYSQIIKIYNNNNKHLLLLKFLTHLVKESIEKKIDFTLENYDSEIFGYSNIRVIYPQNIKNIIQSYEGTGGTNRYFLSLCTIFYEKIIITFALEKEIENMLLAYLELLQPPLEGETVIFDNLRILIEECECETCLEKIEQDLIPIVKCQRALLKKTANFFLKVLLDYAKSKNMQITLDLLYNEHH